ncbi:MAG TPA: GGDEF domain-containing protein [Myxococcota bacterium]|nr:GGDEF domain-containing protein [Myxococcota bacterium]HQK49641.1 GGDEF domain-containing protein [Myxococcota bacterium]
MNDGPPSSQTTVTPRHWHRVRALLGGTWAATTLTLGVLGLGLWRVSGPGEGRSCLGLLGLTALAFLVVTWACLRLWGIVSSLLVQARELRVLEEAGRAAASTLDLEDMGRRIGQVLLDAFPDIVGVVLTVVASDAGPHRDLVRVRDRSLKPLLIGQVHRTLRLDPTVANASWLRDSPPSGARTPALRVLPAPLFSPAQGTVLGFISLVVRDARRPPQEVQPLLEPLSRHVSLAIENWRLYTLATEDGLTGLYVRRYLDARLREEFDRSARSGKHFCVVMIDVDNLKTVNDRWGHGAGDRLLREVGEALRQSVRAMDVPGRIGGDEFLVLLPDMDLAEGLQTARRIHAEVARRSFQEQGTTIRPGVSIGVASTESPEPPASAKALQARADEALYVAKRGAEKIVLWTPGIGQAAPSDPVNSGR